MNLKCGDLYFVVFLVFSFARNGLPSDTPKNIQISSTEVAKTDADDSAVKIIVPKAEIISNTSITPPPTTVSKKTTSSTTSSTTTSTTPATTTSTTAATTTTTVEPQPPTPNIGKWVVKNDTTNTSCIITQMAMQINVTYPSVKNEIQNATIYVPAKGSSASGSCSNPESITINWGPNHNLTINFGMNSTAKDFFISGVILEVNATIFNNVNNNLSKIVYDSGKVKKFATPVELSYKCSKAQSLNLTSSDPLQSLKAVLTLTDIQFEAYMNKTEAKFSTAQDCEPFETPDVVPIAVGCALAILVLVVLVAYLIGRKRSQNRGYLSM